MCACSCAYSIHPRRGDGADEGCRSQRAPAVAGPERGAQGRGDEGEAHEAAPGCHGAGCGGGGGGDAAADAVGAGCGGRGAGKEHALVLLFDLCLRWQRAKRMDACESLGICTRPTGGWEQKLRIRGDAAGKPRGRLRLSPVREPAHDARSTQIGRQRSSQGQGSCGGAQSIDSKALAVPGVRTNEFTHSAHRATNNNNNNTICSPTDSSCTSGVIDPSPLRRSRARARRRRSD